MNDLPQELHVQILMFLDLRDVLQMQCVSKYWYSLCQEQSLWFSLFHSFVRSENCISFWDKYCLISEVDDSINWKDLFSQYYSHNLQNQRGFVPSPPPISDEDENESEKGITAEEGEYSLQTEIFKSEKYSKYGYSGIIDQEIKLHVLFVGDEDGEMEKLFYYLKFSPSWEGIHYLRTFGEILHLSLYCPPLNIILACWRTSETRVAPPSFNDSYFRPALHFQTKEVIKIGRSILMCLNRNEIENQLENIHDKDFTPPPTLTILRDIINQPDHIHVPVLIFLTHKDRDLGLTNSRTTISRLCEFFRFQDNNERHWRISIADVNSSGLIGVYYSLRWLYLCELDLSKANSK